MKEFGIPEMCVKNEICLDNRTYVGTSFVRRRGRNEFGMYVGVVQIKLNVVTWNSLKWSYNNVIWDRV